MNTSMEKVTYLVITRNRLGDTLECVKSIKKQKYSNIEIVIVDNHSDFQIREELQNSLSNIDNIKLLLSSKNLGVSGGRNLGLINCDGDIIITIDDDAYIEDCMLTDKVVKHFKSNDNIGALAFKILTASNREIEKGAFPSKNKKRSVDEIFETSWFIGAGHAIKHVVYNRVGLYNDYFPYGHEELDLAFRIIDGGYKIYYFPEAVVYHKKTPTSRVLTGEKEFIENQLSKRIIVAIRNLPWGYVVTTSIVRTAHYLFVRSNFCIIGVLDAYKHIILNWNKYLSARKVINGEAVRHIKKLKGPVVF